MSAPFLSNDPVVDTSPLPPGCRHSFPLDADKVILFQLRSYDDCARSLCQQGILAARVRYPARHFLLSRPFGAFGRCHLYPALPSEDDVVQSVTVHLELYQDFHCSLWVDILADEFSPSCVVNITCEALPAVTEDHKVPPRRGHSVHHISAPQIGQTATAHLNGNVFLVRSRRGEAASVPSE